MSPRITRRTFLSTTTLAAAALTLRPQTESQARSQVKPPAKSPILDPSTLAAFADPLPIPAIAHPAGTRPDPDDARKQIPFYQLPIAETSVKLHRDLPPARIWTIGGTFPGLTLESPIAQGMIVEWQNRLPKKHLFAIDHDLHGAGRDIPDVRAAIHLHGGRTPAASDGYPEEWTIPGQSQTCHYPSLQHAATLFYHDHSMGINRLNTWAGMLGFCILRDAREDPLNLPSGPRDIPIAICDRTLRADGQLDYPVSEKPGEVWVPEAFGDAILANGKLRPYLDVEPTLYRFRLLNASNGRFFRLALSHPTPAGAPLSRTPSTARQSSEPTPQFFAIASDQGLLAAPVPLRRITLAPAERGEILIDFSALAGQRLELTSDSFQILQFRVAGPKNASTNAEAVPALSHSGESRNPQSTNTSALNQGTALAVPIAAREMRASAPDGELPEAVLTRRRVPLSSSPEGTQQTVARHGSAGKWSPEPLESRQGRHIAPIYAPVILNEARNPAPALYQGTALAVPITVREMRASAPAEQTTQIPATLHDIPRLAESTAVRTRRLTLDENMDYIRRSMGMLLNNTPWHAPITEKPVLNTTEIWELVNLTDDSHPIHLHLVRFQILDRRPFEQFQYISKGTLHFFGPAKPPAPEEMGWKDTVRADPAMVTRIIIPFDGYAGRYVWHCHILEHEDNEMMRPYEVLATGSITDR